MGSLELQIALDYDLRNEGGEKATEKDLGGEVHWWSNKKRLETTECVTQVYMGH
jgi:hypothetical protein